MKVNPDLESNIPFENTALHNLEFAVEAAGLGLWDLILAEPRFFKLDDRCKELLGLSKTEISYNELFQSIHVSDREETHNALQQALDPATEGTYKAAFRISQQSGVYRSVRLLGKRYRDYFGNAYRLSGIALEISSEKFAFEQSFAADSLARAAINGTGVGLFHINMANNHITYSPAFSLILRGRNDKNLTREDFINNIHPEDRKSRKAAYEAAMRSGDLAYEARAIWCDGTVHWIRTVGSYALDEYGTAVSFSGTVQDITDEHHKAQALKEAEARFSLALRQSEAMFRNVTSTAPTGLWMSDEKGAFTYVNKTLTDWTGMPCEALLGDGWANAITEEDRTRGIAAFSQAVAKRTHYDIEFRIHRANAEVIWCRTAGDPYYLENGLYAGYVGFWMDINDRVIASNKLKESEERLRAIIEQAPIAIGLLTGKDLVVETANEAMIKLWSYRAVIGMPLIEAVPELGGQPFIDLLQNVYATGKPYYGYDMIAKLEHNGVAEGFYFDFVYTPVKKFDGEVTGVMVLAIEVTEQVLARKAVEESDRVFRSLIDEAPVATALYVGRTFVVEMANDAMIQLWGKENSVIGTPLREALPELEGQSFLTILDDVFTTGLSYHTQEARADLVVNGVLNSFYFNFTYKPLKNDRGEIYAILNMAVDVTEQVLVRKKIEESELFSRSIIENSPVAKIVFTGESMVVSTANEKMLEMLGRNTSIIGRSFMEAIPELMQIPWLERLTQVIGTGGTFYQSEEKVELTRQGKPYTGYYNLIYKALPNTSGEFYGVIVTATDITDQVLARHKIVETEEALRGAVELAELGTWSMDLSTGVLDYSLRLRNWFGFDATEPITIKKAYRAVTESDRHLVKRSTRNAIKQALKKSYDIEYNIIDKSTGNKRILHAQGKAFFNEQGRAYKFSGTAQDVTKQRNIQTALEQEVHKRTEELQALNEELTATNEELNTANDRLMYSNEELAQYAYVASHDLQEPLRKIRIYSDMLDNQQYLSEENKTLVTKIRQSSERMTLLIRDLLEFSRLLKSDTLMGPVDLSMIVHAVVEDFELTIKEKNADIRINKLPVIEAVNLQMNQLFYNLLSNALKFADAGKQPVIIIDASTITLKEATKYVQKPLPFSNYYRITFTDNGIGFEPQYSEQIFEVFKRLHGRNMYPGSGIGLALCRRIISNHNGHLYAESRPGESTSFHIIIPDSQQDSETRRAEKFYEKAY